MLLKKATGTAMAQVATPRSRAAGGRRIVQCPRCRTVIKVPEAEGIAFLCGQCGAEHTAKSIEQVAAVDHKWATHGNGLAHLLREITRKESEEGGGGGEASLIDSARSSSASSIDRPGRHLTNSTKNYVSVTDDDDEDDEGPPPPPPPRASIRVSGVPGLPPPPSSTCEDFAPPPMIRLASSTSELEQKGGGGHDDAEAKVSGSCPELTAVESDDDDDDEYEDEDEDEDWMHAPPTPRRKSARLQASLLQQAIANSESGAR